MTGKIHLHVLADPGALNLSTLYWKEKASAMIN